MKNKCIIKFCLLFLCAVLLFSFSACTKRSEFSAGISSEKIAQPVSTTKTVEYETPFSKINISYETPGGYQITFPYKDLATEEMKKRTQKGENIGDIEVVKDNEIVFSVNFPNKKVYEEKLKSINALSAAPVEDHPTQKVEIIENFEKDGNKYLFCSYEITGSKPEYQCLIDIPTSEKQGISCYSTVSSAEAKKFLDIFTFSLISDKDVQIEGVTG